MNWSIAEAGKYKNKERDWQKEMRKGGGYVWADVKIKRIIYGKEGRKK